MKKSTVAHVIRCSSKGVQFRPVTKLINGVRKRVQEEVAPGYSLTLIDGNLQTVKV